jgi:arginyl-tRNA synthetase
MNYSDVLSSAFRAYKPNLVAGYLLEVCRAFNHFYHKHKILTGDEKLLSSRMTLVWSTNQILTAGLKVLNIETPEYM